MSQSIIDEAKRVLKIEANSIMDSVDKVGDNFVKAVELMKNCKGKVILTGMGKSGIIAKKISSTLSSTGTSSTFVHPAESLHGDLGTIGNSDIVIAISNSGESSELFPVLTYCGRRGIPVVGMTSNEKSTLGQAGIFIDIGVKEEACSLGLAPTSSSTVTLAVGDALAMCLLKEQGFAKEDYAEFHPGGSLGKRLLTRVLDVMHSEESLPLVELTSPMSLVISFMTSKEVRGVAGVVNEEQKLEGVITDGDIRRRLEKNNQPFTELAKDLMSRNPKTIDCQEMAVKALFVMEQFSIQTLFVVDKSAVTPHRPVGIIHLQDLLKAGVR